MKQLFIEDLKDLTEDEVKQHLVSKYTADKNEIEKYDILIAYECVGSWGCDSSSFFLLQDKETGQLYEIHGSHCSCYGFEDQFNPQETELQYLSSDKFYFNCGGYDNNEEDNRAQVKEYIQNMCNSIN